MSKGLVLFLGIGVVSGVLGLGCTSEGKIPFDDDELAPDDSAGQGGNSGSSGSGGSSGASGRGGGAGFPNGGSSGSSAGSGGSNAGSGGISGGGSLGRGGTTTTSDPDTVGQSCSLDSSCRSIPGGYCADAGFCTAACKTHVDCGCPPGTVNNDIAAGECSAACVTYESGASYCQRVCNSSEDCEGGLACSELDFYGVCSPS